MTDLGHEPGGVEKGAREILHHHRTLGRAEPLLGAWAVGKQFTQPSVTTEPAPIVQTSLRQRAAAFFNKIMTWG